MIDRITVRGARQHNLKNINVEIPRHTLTVVTGLSGSGKSSLAFDVIFAKGQRRYVQTLSAYARQFLDQMERPGVGREVLNVTALAFGVNHVERQAGLAGAAQPRHHRKRAARNLHVDVLEIVLPRATNP